MIVSDGSPTPNDPPRILRVINDRKGIILGVVTLCMAAAAYGYTRMPNEYMAEAVLVLDVRKLQGLPSESVVSALPQESPVLRTELDIINSRMMAERVLTILDRQGYGPPTIVAGAADAQASNPIEPRLGDPLGTEFTHSRADIDALLADLSVVNDGRSFTIYIAFHGADPDYAAAVANAFGQAYRDYQVDLQNAAIRRVSEWLGEKLISLRTKLEQSEGVASDYREKAGLVLADGMTLPAQQISALNTEAAALHARLAGSKARLTTAVAVSQGHEQSTLAEMLASPTIQQLRTEESRVERLIAELNENRVTKSAQLPQLLSQRAALRSQVQAAMQQIIDSIRNEIDVMERQQRAIFGTIDKIQQGMGKTNDAMLHAAQLEREANANRAIYESYLTRYKQTIEQDGIAAAEAHIISPAVPPRRKASPRLPLWLAGGGALGLALGLAAAFLIDLRDKTIRSLKELEADTGEPIIACIPKLSNRERNERQHLVSDGRSNFGRALADLQAYLRLSAPRKSSLLVTVTSATEQEGKTLVVAGLARSIAASGLRTVVVDANLRNPMVAHEFGANPDKDLEDIIRGNEPYRAVVHHDELSRVDFIASRPCTVPPEFLLGNERFSRLLEELKGAYDVILIDTPALSAGADAVRAASLADMTVFIVHRQKARTEDVVVSMRKLSAETTRIAGIAINCGSNEDRLFGYAKPQRTIATAIENPPARRQRRASTVRGL